MNDFYRIKSERYITISNDFLKDKNLSNKTKGVLAMILALPDNWDFSIKGMVSITKDGEASLRTAINELKKEGYCIDKPVRINGKIARWKYYFSGEKITESLLCDFLKVENLNVENRAQYNNIINEENIKNKENRLSNDNQKAEYSDDFLEFWKLYDYPRGKKTAYTRWRNLSKKDREAAIAAVPAYLEDCVRNFRTKQYPATYLNKRTFEDDFSSKGKLRIYDPLDTDSDEKKRFKAWMRATHPEIENTALPLSYEDYMELVKDEEYGGVDVVESALVAIESEIWKYRKTDIRYVIRRMIENGGQL